MKKALVFLVCIEICLLVLAEQRRNEPKPPNVNELLRKKDTQPPNAPLPYLSKVIQPPNGPIPYLNKDTQPPNGPLPYLNKTGISSNSEGEFRVFSGDIMLTEEDIRSLEEKACMESDNLKWPKSGSYVRIPYAIYSLGYTGRSLMPRVVQEYKTHTCIDFQEVNPYTAEYELAIVNYGGCASWMGKKNFSDGYQIVHLDPGCEYFGTMLHEFGHAIGLFHEHERPDRDQYISLDLSNVYPERRYNYDLSNCNTAGTEYDLTSIMHYDYKGFSSNGKMVVGVKQIDKQYLLGVRRDELSHWDKVTINKLYGCLDDWQKMCQIGTNPCRNGGYIDRWCRCVCPRGTEGTYCERRVGPYYPPNPLNCGGNISSPQTIHSPSGGSVGDCIWIISAPAGRIVRLQIEDIQLIDNCYSITLNIRWQDKYLGNTFCMNSEIRVGSYFDSTRETMVVHWENKYPYEYGRFKASIRFL